MVSSLPVHCPLVKLYCHYILNIDLPGATDTQLDCIMCVYVNEWEKIKGGAFGHSQLLGSAVLLLQLWVAIETALSKEV